MPTRTSMNVSLTPELEQFVQSRVASGLFQTASEVVSEGLRLLEEREQARETALEELRGKIRRGIQQADRGELLEADAVFKEIRQLSARHRSKTGVPSSEGRWRGKVHIPDEKLTADTSDMWEVARKK
jgi:antitoxin ParD1/3/4